MNITTLTYKEAADFRSILRHEGFRVEAPKAFVVPTGTAAQIIIDQNEDWVLETIKASPNLIILGRTATRIYVGMGL
jgi:hypothetical protein